LNHLLKLLKARSGNNSVVIEQYKRFQTYLYHVGQLPLDQVPRTDLIRKVGYDLLDLKDPKVRNLATLFLPAYGQHIKYFHSTHSPSENRILHEDDLPRLCKFFNISTRYTVADILLQKESKKNSVHLPKAPEERTIPFYHHDAPKYTWVDATEVNSAQRREFKLLEDAVWSFVKDQEHRTVYNAIR